MPDVVQRILAFPDGPEFLSAGTISAELIVPSLFNCTVIGLVVLSVAMGFRRSSFSTAIAVTAHGLGIAVLCPALDWAFLNRAMDYREQYSSPEVGFIAVPLMVWFMIVAALLLLPTRTRAWFNGTESEGLKLRAAAKFAFRKPATWIAVLLGPICLFYTFPVVAMLSPIGNLGLFNYYIEVPSPIRWLSDQLVDGDGIYLGVLYANAFTAMLLALRFQVHTDGIIASISSFPLLSPKWSRVRFVDCVQSTRSGRSLTIKYWGRLRIPCSLNLRAASIEDGAALLEQILTILTERATPTRVWTQPRRSTLTGWGLITGGAILGIAVNPITFWLDGRQTAAIDAGNFQTLGTLAFVLPLTLSHSIAVLLIGIGIGMLAVRVNGVGSLLILALWLIGSQVVPDPLLYLLKWISVHAILAVIQTPVEGTFPLVPLPSPIEWELGFYLLILSPAIAGLGYVLGVVAGRRPLALLRSASLPRAKADLVEP